MQQAMIASDADKVATYLADDFKSFNGVNTNPNNKGRNREDFLKRVSTFKDFVNYASLKRTNGAYPDALEYKDDEDGLWVQTWDSFKGVHAVTGVKLDGPVHRLFIVALLMEKLEEVLVQELMELFIKIMIILIPQEK